MGADCLASATSTPQRMRGSASCCLRIPHDLVFNSGDTSADDIAAAIIQAMGAHR